MKPSKMIGGDYSLELNNIFHTGQVEPVSCFQRLFGSIQTGLILKDITFEVRAGEVMAVLGSKGSGKRALLEVIARRSKGVSRGQILLDGRPLTQAMFNQCCAYVGHRADLLPSLSVQQTLHYAANLSIGSQVSDYVKDSRVRQVLADLALSQVARRSVEALTEGEYRRLVIGTQLVKDPVLLLLDEPTAGLDPLTTYLIVSMVSSHAKRRGRAVVLTMEKPRSDVFPFLERVAYLCLGDLVYAGPTRMMLDYFRAVGFPCPEMENPLMYYLCLSTVDRRSRERFVESNAQIVALVEKFKMEGAPYRKSSAMSVLLGSPPSEHQLNSHPYPYSAQDSSTTQIGMTLYQRQFASTFGCSWKALFYLAARLLALPIAFLLVWIFFRNVKDYQSTFTSRSGLLLTCILTTYLTSVFTAAYTYAPHRTRYYQENQDGTYNGPLFLISYFTFSLPLALITVTGSSTIMYQSYRGISDWLIWFTYATQTRYVGAYLTSQAFYSRKQYIGLPQNAIQNCSIPAADIFVCRYLDGDSYVNERYPSAIIDAQINLIASFVFPLTAMIFNILLYVSPLPSFIKAKFRE
ncbi:ATP-binding cassette sub-family G member 5 isoform X2 [Daktulosphaira vitifoliae]|uniref:ATP-binding cassette sub-family G member 5 isoform X2 n=1 Tax=Daktulosphaira vitifoliae TaxID=58002 RepID=UPI0021A99293|nr:ATP-binding cassette sub-family G member 5 isoform X2 [Daktulosphaira vitifoliae]